MSIETPWQKVFRKFSSVSDNQSDFARLFGWDRSKVSRALADEEGLINGRDQKTILEVAEKLQVKIEPSDLVPGA